MSPTADSSKFRLCEAADETATGDTTAIYWPGVVGPARTSDTDTDGTSTTDIGAVIFDGLVDDSAGDVADLDAADELDWPNINIGKGL